MELRTAMLVAWAVVGMCPALADDQSFRLSFLTPQNAWRFEGRGPYEGWTDRRDLFVLRHPWSASEAGSQGEVSREVTLPAAWTGPVRLHFYMMDDYHGERPRLKEGDWLGQIKLIGHRFKQVLLDGEVIWERDVADSQGIRGRLQTILLPERVKGGDRVRIAFRMIDKVGTGERLPEDFRHIGSTDGIKETDEWKFMTNLYVGDVTLTPGDVETLPPSEPPGAEAARARHAEQWPLPPYGRAFKFPVALKWEGSDDVTPDRVPIHCGVPLPAGVVNDLRRVVLADRQQRRLPVQANALNHWPDGTLRWVEIDTIAAAGDLTRELFLDIDRAEDSLQPMVPDPVTVTPDGAKTFVLRTGAVEVIVGGPGGRLIRRLSTAEGGFEDLTAEIEIEGRVYRPVIETATIRAKGPIRGEVELSGHLVADHERMGPCVFRLSAFAGQPYVRMTWRVFNTRAETLKVSRFDLLGRHRPDAGARTRWNHDGKTAGTDVCLRQPAEDRCTVTAEGGQLIEEGTTSPGWLAIGGEKRTLLVHVRHFREQFPKALEFKGDRLRIALFEPSEKEPHYLPTEGEAKRHEIWLGLWDQPLSPGALRRVTRCFARPPRLFDPEYFCASGGFWHAAAHDAGRFSDFDAIVKRLYGNIEAKQFYVNGIRHWGDYPYGENWCNGYYDAPQGMAAEYFMSGDPRWFDHLEATMRHIIDVDVCHASAANPGWVGALHCGECGPNHTSSFPWAALQRPKGWLALWRLTGDTDVRDAALGMADAAVRENTGIGSYSVRDHAGALNCLMAAYDETLDPKYLDAAGRVAHDAMGRIDRRRGAYSEVHGNVGYRGNVPWMCAQLAEPMYEYYRCSGDIEAAIAVVGLAESILTENRTRDVPGDVYGYSHNPHFKKTAGYHVLIAPAVLYAYELTGDAFFLDNARAMYAQMIREQQLNSVRNCYWNAPTLLYYLQRYTDTKDPAP